MQLGFNFMRKLISVLLLVAMVSGCTTYFQSFTEQITKEIINQNPAAKSFLEQHPNATIDVSLVPQGEMISQIEKIKIFCPNFGLDSYYKVTFADPQTNESFFAWVNTKDYKVECITAPLGTGSMEIPQTIPATNTTAA